MSGDSFIRDERRLTMKCIILFYESLFSRNLFALGTQLKFNSFN